MTMNPYLALLVMSVLTYATRVLPLTLLRSQVNNRYIRSFLYYVPYVTLAVMTFPSMLFASESVFAAACALAVGIVASWRGVSMFKVALCCSAVVFILELFLV